jgi:hypothetical protein
MTRKALATTVSVGLVCSAVSAGAVPPAGEPGVVVEDGSDAVLSLGVRAEATTVRKELLGFVGLSVPLERLSAPRRVARAGEVVAPSPPPAAPLAEHGLASERTDAATDTTVRPLEARSLSLLARGALAAARRAERAPERERALDGLASRARLAALLPEVRFRAARTRDESLRLTPTTDDPYRFTLAGGDALLLEGAATFRLSNLLFADEELAVDRLRIERERGVERRMARVLDRVLAWHGAVVRLAAPHDDAEELRSRLELEAATVELDVLTGGWFGARVEALGVVRELPPVAPSPAPPADTPAEGSERRERAPVPSLDALRLSARPSEPCLPMHETGSPTFRGASMR